MKKLLLLCMTALFCFACNESKTVTVTVTNPLALERSNEVIEVSMETVTNRLGLADTAQIVVLNVDGQQLPYQITYDGKVIFPATVAANSSATYTIQAGIPESFDVKACGKCYPDVWMIWPGKTTWWLSARMALLCRQKGSVDLVMTCLPSAIVPNRFWRECLQRRPISKLARN